MENETKKSQAEEKPAPQTGPTASPGGGLPDQVRTWAMACHLMALSGVVVQGIGFVLGPLVMWLIKKDDHPFIDEQGKEAVNFQITMLIALVVSAFLCLIFIGFVLLPVVFVVDIIFVVIASIRAKDGEYYRYPFSIRFIK